MRKKDGLMELYFPGKLGKGSSGRTYRIQNYPEKFRYILSWFIAQSDEKGTL
jgi:hypothetical protein